MLCFLLFLMKIKTRKYHLPERSRWAAASLRKQLSVEIIKPFFVFGIRRPYHGAKDGERSRQGRAEGTFGYSPTPNTPTSGPRIPLAIKTGTTK